MSRSGREAVPNVREWSGCYPKCPGMVGRPSRMSGSGQEILLNVQKALLDIQEWWIGPPSYPGVVD